MSTLSKKQSKVLEEFDLNKFSILEGDLRTGKSHIANMYILEKHLKTLPACNILVSDCTKNRLFQSIVCIWELYLKDEFIKIKDKYGNDCYSIRKEGLWDKNFYFIPGTANNALKIKKISFKFWFAEHAFSQSDIFLEMAITRLCLVGSKAILINNNSTDSKSYFVKEFKSHLGKLGKCYKFYHTDNPVSIKQDE